MFGNELPDSRHLRVKICGLTNKTDAQAAIDAGADALGFNGCADSRRFIDLATADWIGELSGQIRRIAILVNASRAQALAIATLPFVDALQLHGEEAPEYCADLARQGVHFSKALPAQKEASEAPDFSTNTIVLDSNTTAGFGGTGTTFPWEIARRFIDAHPHLRVVLAGGLNPENVAQAVRETQPFAVDVTTGVEIAPGRKDHARMRDFVVAARAAGRR